VNQVLAKWEKVMSVRVLLPNAFQKHTNNVREIASTAANLPKLVTDMRAFSGASPALRGETGRFAALSTSMSTKRYPLPGQ